MAYPWHIHGMQLGESPNPSPPRCQPTRFHSPRGQLCGYAWGLSGCICLFAELPNSHQHAVLLWLKGKSAGKTLFFQKIPVKHQINGGFLEETRPSTSLSPSESPYFHQGPRTPPRLAAVHGWVRHLEGLSARHVRCATTSRLNFRRHPRP